MPKRFIFKSEPLFSVLRNMNYQNTAGWIFYPEPVNL